MEKELVITVFTLRITEVVSGKLESPGRGRSNLATLRCILIGRGPARHGERGGDQSTEVKAKVKGH